DVTARLDVPLVVAAPAGPERPLNAAELAGFEAAWQRWDAFLTFVVKHIARDGAGEELRLALNEVLISARYDIAAILAGEPAGPDPVQALFVQSWERLAPVLREMQTGLPGEAAVRYSSFIAAADALRGIQSLGPGAGIDLSADGLRRLARIIAPVDPADPLGRDEAVDAELRELMGFGPPIARPQNAGGAGLLERFVGAAYAAARVDPVLVVKLNRWVPTFRNIDGYLPLADELLGQIADFTVVEKRIPAEHHEMFRHLLRATAWKESCWRQYVRNGGEIAPLTSIIGALGMMQVNPATWRGFYEVDGLAGDIGYNARAGADILAHYLVHYSIRKGEDKHGIEDALARATYAVYNGGPSHLRRYRSKGTKRSLRQIDAAFYEMYQTIAAGKIQAVSSCYSD
ncbi:MAG: lytic transglycosylase domain-containing protein, partial [Gammaproteobacteria bacterium]|nr:lytic transglycosylase domain-containing protein [Gammaproteobacteria bacterium]